MHCRFSDFTSCFCLPVLMIGSALVGCSSDSAGKPPAARQAKLTLPAYRLAQPRANEATLRALANNVFGLDAAPVADEDDPNRLILSANDKTVEMYRQSGGIWLADQSQLYKVELQPKLPDEQRAREIADAFLQQNKLFPKVDGGEGAAAALQYEDTSATSAVIYNADTGQRTSRQLDVQVIYGVQLRVQRDNREPTIYPIVGGGGEMNVTIGDGGRIIGYSGVWRPIQQVEAVVEITTEAEADKQFQALTQGTKARKLGAFLAYYSAPASAKQTILAPVWVYQGEIQADGKTCPMRNVIIPATKYGPDLPKAQPIRKRTPRDLPRPGSTVPEERRQRGGARRDGNQPEPDSGSEPATDPVARTTEDSDFECGTSWIGVLGGLPNSQKNAKGFVDGLAKLGWNVNFNHGDYDAWESDWRRDDDLWVDAADFVFYSGHAGSYGWMLESPEDGWLLTSEPGSSPESPGDMWGQNDLEWVVIAACGPLQDEEFVSGGGDAIERWKGAFDGLHILMGYGAVTFDNEDEGKLLAKYCKKQTIIDAWFRAAIEVQPHKNGRVAPNGPTIYVVAMYAYRDGETTPENDYIWGQGPVAPDPVSPNHFVILKVPT